MTTGGRYAGPGEHAGPHAGAQGEHVAPWWNRQPTFGNASRKQQHPDVIDTTPTNREYHNARVFIGPNLLSWSAAKS
jgi:hypothetical protein